MARMNKNIASPTRAFLYALLLSSGVSIGFFLLRLLATGSYRYWFMIWNLLLAWVPLLLVLWLDRRLRLQRWRTWRNMLITVGWLVFLPNSFYVLTDLIHLRSTGEINILFDAVMFSSFVFNAYVVGFASTLLIHRRLERLWGVQRSIVVIMGVFVLCGVAIYLGRVLRWNTWDLLINPAGILFDVSEGVVNPLVGAQLLLVTGMFSLLLSTMYGVIYTAARLLLQRPMPAQRA